jgi:hypothetical protein
LTPPPPGGGVIEENADTDPTQRTIAATLMRERLEGIEELEVVKDILLWFVQVNADG